MIHRAEEKNKMYFRPTLTYNSPEEDRKHSFVKYIANRVLGYNKNFLCAVTGQTGSGKSWLSGSVGEEYSKLTGIPYRAKGYTIFSLRELLDLINDEDLENKLPPGTFLMFDEPQVSVNSREWQSEANQILSTLTSTFRNMRLVIFFATPYLEFLDKQTRILFHGEIKVKGYDRTTNLTLCEPRLLEWNGKKQDFYKKRLIVKYPNPNKNVHDWYYLQEWEVSKPSQAWIEDYEAMKLSFTRKLNKQLQQQYYFTQAQSNKGQDLVTISDLYKQHGENIYKMTQELPHLTPYQIERLLGMVKKQIKAEKEKESKANEENLIDKPVLREKAKKSRLL